MAQHTCKQCGSSFKSGLSWSNTDYCQKCWIDGGLSKSRSQGSSHPPEAASTHSQGRGSAHELTAFKFFAQRYAEGYAAAGRLLTARAVVAGGTALAILGCLIGAFATRSAIFFLVAVLVGLVGFTAWTFFGVIATFLRVLVDTAVAGVPGMTDGERLELIGLRMPSSSSTAASEDATDPGA